MPLFLDSRGQALPNLLFLSISFASLVLSCPYISLPLGSKVQELYITTTQYDVTDLKECNSLTHLGIISRGYRLPGSVALPTSLESLRLYNVLKAETEVPELHRLTSLVYVRLGGRATTQSILKHLPRLPPSLLELDLWDGVITGLDRLTLLTRLRKLRMPSPPSPQQLSVIKQLRQLRHIEVTTFEGTAHMPVLLCLRCSLRLRVNTHLCTHSLFHFEPIVSAPPHFEPLAASSTTALYIVSHIICSATGERQEWSVILISTVHFRLLCVLY